jgi:hypothetical protein
VETAIDQGAGVSGALCVVFDGESLHLLSPEGVSNFGDGNAFASTGIEKGH